MARGPDWMNSASRPVLKLLDDTGVALTPTAITYNLEKRMDRPPSRSTVSRALSGLKETGLVHQPEGTLYEITDEGRAYLAGDLDADELEEEDG